MKPTPQSDTPRTDRNYLNIHALRTAQRPDGTYSSVHIVLADFTRQLERELTAMTKERDELKVLLSKAGCFAKGGKHTNQSRTYMKPINTCECPDCHCDNCHQNEVVESLRTLSYQLNKELREIRSELSLSMVDDDEKMIITVRRMSSQIADLKKELESWQISQAMVCL